MEKYLIVGLGNPGKQYENTRHNVGFEVVDEFAKRHNLSFKEKFKFKGLLAEGIINQNPVYVLKPLTFMNLSGESVALVANYLQILPSKILVVTDDIDLPFLQQKLKINSGPGTHNGLKNVELELRSNRYARLKVGVGSDFQGSLVDYVLSKFTQAEAKLLPGIIDKAVQTIDIWLDRGIIRAMDFANRKIPSNPSNGVI